VGKTPVFQEDRYALRKMLREATFLSP